jgi:PAS domain S-box-containing protein
MNERLEPPVDVNAVLFGGGQMGAEMRALDWSRTAVGPVHVWPQSLRTIVRVLLDSRYAMWLAWGPELTFFCNDAYRPTLGIKRNFLGASARQVWAEIWPDIGPRIDRVLGTGTATWDEGLLLFLERSGFVEETYHSFSYSPVYDDGGGVAGMLCVVSEDTERTIGERRLALLAALSTASSQAREVEEACRQAASQLANDPQDLPFTLLYLLEEDGHKARLAAQTGLPVGAAAAPEFVPLGMPAGAGTADADAPAWPLVAVAHSGSAMLVEDLPARHGALTAGAWPEPLTRAIVLPLARPGANERLAGFLVAGLSTRLPFDAGYRRFFDLVAAQACTAIADARAFAEEKRRVEALAELDRAKTVFFSNVSHELRTPLTLMLAPIDELLAAGPEAAADAQSQLQLAQRNGQRLLRLVNTLLDFSRIEAGRIQARYEPLDLAALTADLASVFRSTMERAGLALVIDCPPLGEPVFVDRGMWEKIVLNLLSNAFKFTFEGEVRVSLRADAESAYLSVSDTGTGIDEAALPHLFERFYRVVGARGRSIEGSGIGLALVHELVRLHGGEVAAHSRPGQGSRFAVSIPLGQSHLPAERIAAASARPDLPGDVLPDFGTDELQALREAGWAGLDAPSQPGELRPLAPPEQDAAASEPGAVDDRPTVLVAEDNADMRGYLHRLLAGSHRVIAAADGEAALALARAERPDLVLSDVMMPRLDGFGLVNALRGDADTAGVPVILLSARAGEEARIEGLAAGADDYLVKPFHARELLARVTGTLALSRLRRERAEREAALREETENVLESVTEGFVAIDADWRVTYANSAAEGLVSMRRETMLGRTIWELFPDLAGHSFEAPYRRAMRERVPVRVDARYEALGVWFEVNVYPVAGGGLAFYFRDVLASRLMEAAVRSASERNRLLVSLDDAMRALDDADEIVAVSSRLVGQHFEADRCAFAQVEPDGEHVRVGGAWCREGVAPIGGRLRMLDFGAGVIDPQRAGDALVVNDARGDPRVGDSVATWEAAGIRAAVSVPLLRNGAMVATLALHQSAPRRWDGEEVELIRLVISRCWDAVERARAVSALRASEQRFRRVADSLPHSVFMFDAAGTPVWANRHAAEFAGSADVWLATRRYELIHPDDRARVRTEWRRSLATGEPYEADVRMRRADGAWRWTLSRAAALRDETGNITEWIAGSIDVDDLRCAQQALQAADRRKDEFLATLAHELRNPLAPLRNAVHILQMTQAPEAAARVHAMMQRQIDHMVRLVDDLLEVSRITGGKIELRRAPVEVASVLSSAAETSRPLVEAGGHRLEIDIDEAPMPLDADAVRLAQVFANLLNNAAKYTDPGGRIDLVARREGAQARISVRDTGIGIAADMLPRVFDLFTQIDRDMGRSQGGLGIGLALVKSLIGMHGGSVEAASAGPGRGAEFTVRLPLAVNGAPAQAAAAPAASRPSAVERVLVVDDNHDAADSLGVLLEFLGARVQVVHDGQAALAALPAHRPGIVLLDLGMPGMDGYEVARRMRAMPQGAGLTLVALTGWGQARDRERTLASGFDHHLVKPAGLNELSDLLKQARRGEAAQ